MDNLAAPIAELTEAVRSLTKWKQGEQTAAQRSASEFPRIIREEFTVPMRELNDSLHELTLLMKEAHRDRRHATAALDDLMSRLTDTLTEPRTSPGIVRPEGRRFWQRRSLTSMQGPVA